MPDRYYIDTQGPDDQAILAGARWLVDTAATARNRAVLAIPLVSNVEHLERSLGAGVAAALRKQRKATIEGVTVELAIQRSANLARGATTLAIWPTEEQLGRLEDAGPTALCVIPWSEQEVSTWLRAWGPIELRSGESAASVVVSNQVVEAALKSLTRRVNLSSGLGHPSDRAAAVGMFKILQGSGETWDAAEVRAWALGHGWSSRGAADLADLALRIGEGRRVQQRDPHGWIENIIELWRESAGNDE